MTFKYNEIWSLVGEIQKIPYGSGFCVQRYVWEDIVPRPDPMRQLLLASSGHRPETERTPEDWFRFWLNGPTDDDFLKVKKEPYDVEMEIMSGDMIIRLPLKLCPKCHGRGSYQQWPREDSRTFRSATAPMSQTVQIETVQCAHQS